MMAKFYVYEEDRLIAVVHGRDSDDAIRSACFKTGRDCGRERCRAEQIVRRERRHILRSNLDRHPFRS